MRDITKSTIKNINRKKRSPAMTTAVLVSLFWLLVAGTILAYVEHGHTSYDKGVLDGITKTKAILQGK